jgi:glycogen synthase
MFMMNEKEFIKKWIEKISSELLKDFPNDFINDEEWKKFDMPGKSLILGPELFGTFEIIDIDDNVFFQAENIYKAKYILYANRTKPDEIKIPLSETDIKAVVKNYENHIDSIVKIIEEDLMKQSTNPHKFLRVSNSIFNNLNIQRY